MARGHLASRVTTYIFTRSVYIYIYILVHTRNPRNSLTYKMQFTTEGVHIYFIVYVGTHVCITLHCFHVQILEEQKQNKTINFVSAFPANRQQIDLNPCSKKAYFFWVMVLNRFWTYLHVKTRFLTIFALYYYSLIASSIVSL